MPADVAVIDYGVGNLLSVRRGFEKCGATVEVTGDARILLTARRVVLPGVGAFADGMAGLRRAGLEAVVRELAASGRPFLGICLGMQMLFDESFEFGRTTGLGLIPGTVRPVPTSTTSGEPLKVPHIGWSALVPVRADASWGHPWLAGLPAEQDVYFVHSFMASPSDPLDRVADCVYGGNRIAAIVARGNVLGCQFHPEKSGPVGLDLLGRFLSL